MPNFDELEGGEQLDNFDQNLVHISKIQTRGRKCITTVRGVGEEFDYKKIVKFCKKNFKCQGHIREQDKPDKKDKGARKVDNEDDGPKKQQIVFSGNHSNAIKQFLVYMGITMEENIRVHGGN